MANFETALKKVLRHEGVKFDSQNVPLPGHTGYVDHPSDPGGETNWGITHAVARRNGFVGHMRLLTYRWAKKIYHNDYWQVLHAQEIDDQEIAEELFDTAVNCGPEVAQKFLQRTLNALNVKGTKYPDLVVDGVIGARTIDALNAALRIALWYRLCILRALDSLQCVRYIELAEQNEKFESFVPGWLRIRVGVAETTNTDSLGEREYVPASRRD